MESRGYGRHFKLLKAANIPLPPLAEQKRIVAKVDELMALCDQLEAQQQERDAQHTALTRAAVARFTTDPTPTNLNLLFHKSYHIPPTDLRKTILTLAVQGKLVPQDPSEEPVSELLARNAARRAEQKRIKNYAEIDAESAPFEIPTTWHWEPLGNLALTSDSGWSPQCEPQARSGDKWGVLKVSAVSWGKFLPDQNKALPPGKEPRPEAEVHSGDFLMSRANTADLVARSVIVEESPRNLMMSDKIVRFRFAEEINKSYINLVNSASFARSYYAKNASGTSSSMKNVGRQVMCDLPVPVPPLAEQRRIVAKVDQLMALVDQLESQLEHSSTTAESLMAAVVAELTTTE